jgi:hypothetical protein
MVVNYHIFGVKDNILIRIIRSHMGKMDCFPRKQFIDVPIKMIYASTRTFSISSIRPSILQPVTIIGRITWYFLPGGQHF